jgi:prepilin-type N-terminal cleavage/methylation domain-containing protein
MRRENGFTLIELMIAIGLAGLLLSAAVPALDTFVSNARQTGAINDFVSSIHQATQYCSHYERPRNYMPELGRYELRGCGLERRLDCFL